MDPPNSEHSAFKFAKEYSEVGFLRKETQLCYPRGNVTFPSSLTLVNPESIILREGYDPVSIFMVECYLLLKSDTAVVHPTCFSLLLSGGRFVAVIGVHCVPVWQWWDRNMMLVSMGSLGKRPAMGGRKAPAASESCFTNPTTSVPPIILP
jgi:hypothetical protein